MADIILNGADLQVSLTRQQRWLHRFAGSWRGVTRTWLDPNQAPEESPCQATIDVALGGLYIVHKYESTLQGRRHVGLVLYSYDSFAEQFTAVWVDSFHTGSYTMVSRGADGSDTHKVVLLGEYPVADSQPWGWRTELDALADDEFRWLAYNISPEGHEDPAMETVYHRD